MRQKTRDKMWLVGWFWQMPFFAAAGDVNCSRLLRRCRSLHQAAAANHVFRWSTWTRAQRTTHLDDDYVNYVKTTPPQNPAGFRHSAGLGIKRPEDQPRMISGWLMGTSLFPAKCKQVLLHNSLIVFFILAFSASHLYSLLSIFFPSNKHHSLRRKIGQG